MVSTQQANKMSWARTSQGFKQQESLLVLVVYLLVFPLLFFVPLFVFVVTSEVIFVTYLSYFVEITYLSLSRSAFESTGLWATLLFGGKTITCSKRRSLICIVAFYEVKCLCLSIVVAVVVNITIRTSFQRPCILWWRGYVGILLVE